jgi:hypothetical protein
MLKPEKHVNGGRFSGAIEPNEPNDFSALNRERRVLYCRRSSIEF